VTRRGRPARAAGLLFLACLVVYNANGREISSADTVPTRLLPVAIIQDRTLHLDRFVREPPPGAGLFSYSVKHTRGHHVSTYPIVGALLALPIYLLPVALLGVPSWAVINALSKLSASAMAAGSVVLLYLALRRLGDEGRALRVALVYGLATATWSVSSQGLWQHAPAQLLMTAALYLVLRGAPGWAGVALGLMVAARPPTALIGASLVGYAIRDDWRRGARMAAAAGATWLPVLAYNLWYFASPLGGYAWIQETNRTLHFVETSWSTTVIQSAASLLASPNRGLLAYSPVLAFALVALARVAIRREPRLGAFLAAGFLASLALVSSYAVSWGGHSFGPRYLADFLPVLAVFLMPAMEWVERSRPVAAGFACLLAASIAVQVIGVFFYPSPRAVEWNKTPRDVDVAAERVWDWRDPHLLRLLRNGPRPFGFAPAE
jgi:hypothetical protein